MDIKRYIRRRLRMKLYKKLSDYCPDSIDRAIEWMMSKPLKDWPLAYRIICMERTRIVNREAIFQWFRR